MADKPGWNPWQGQPGLNDENFDSHHCQLPWATGNGRAAPSVHAAGNMDRPALVAHYGHQSHGYHEQSMSLAGHVPGHSNRHTPLWPAFIGHGVKGGPPSSSHTVYPASGGPWPSHDTASSATATPKPDSSRHGHLRFSSEASIAATTLPPRQPPAGRYHTAAGVDASGYFPRQLDVYQGPHQQPPLWSSHAQVSHGHSQQTKPAPVDLGNGVSFGVPMGAFQQPHNNMWNSRLFDFKIDTSNADAGQGYRWPPNSASASASTSTARLPESFSLPMLIDSADVQNYFSRKQSIPLAAPAVPSAAKTKPPVGDNAPRWEETRARPDPEDTANCYSIAQHEMAATESLTPRLLHDRDTREWLADAATSRGAD